MRMQLYNIVSELRPYVKLICSMDCDGEADTSCIRVLPDSCVELFVNYTSSPIAIIGNELYKGSVINARMNKPMDVQMRKGAGCLAICFYPGMAYKFFHLPMRVLTNKITAMEDVWESKAAEIEDKLETATDNERRSAIIQEYLLEQLTKSKDDKQIAYSLSRAKDTPGSLTVNDLTNELGISQRHLARKFEQCVGLSPKEYLRVSRFISSLQHLKRHPLSTLTEIAYESGYFDQSHFIRDYKTYTGETPGEVVRSPHILY